MDINFDEFFEDEGNLLGILWWLTQKSHQQIQQLDTVWFFATCLECELALLTLPGDVDMLNTKRNVQRNTTVRVNQERICKLPNT
uniref:Uncharacterized protein n=1 Tax=Romanomermis culicivorax TaxID=13658 RepID=A0A915J0Q8_ROMCU